MQFYKKMLLCRLTIVSLLFGTFSHALATTQRFGKPYIIETPNSMILGKQDFTPLLISGNGEIVYGNTSSGLAKWTDFAGVKPVMNASVGYNLFPEATNFDGSAVAGFFTRGHGALQDYGLFLWSTESGVSIIKPHFIPPPLGGIIHSIQISDTGNSISFFCENQEIVQVICSSNPDLNKNSYVGKIWSSGLGFQRDTNSSRKNYNYVNFSANLNVHIVGMLGTSNFGKVDDHGVFTKFKGFPSDFDPKADKVIINRDAKFVVLEETAKNKMFVWNTAGDRIDPLRLPLSCEGFIVTNVDDLGAFFGTAFCPKLSAPSPERIGLRVTSTSALTIHDWLRLSGLPNYLGSVTEILLVSDNGKTVYGTTNSLWGSGNRNGVKMRSGVRDYCLTNRCAFLAHLP